MPVSLDHEFEVGFDPHPTTALGFLIHKGKEEDIDQRLQSDINWVEEEYHPLHAALLAGKDMLARKLLEKGSPVVSHTFYIAYRFGNPLTFQTLLEKYQPALIGDTASPKNISSLFLDVIRSEDTVTASILCPLLPDIEVTDYFYGFENWTALHHASLACNQELITLLLTAKADPNLHTAKGDTCLDLAHRNTTRITPTQRKASAKLLMTHGAHSAKLSWLQKFVLGNYGYVL